MKDNSSDRTYLITILKTIFDKASDKNNSGPKELELYIRNRVNAYLVEESLEKIIENIKKEIFENNPIFKQNILHGNMKIFEILFSIIRLYKVSDKIYFNIVSILLNFLTETNENEKVLITNAASTIIKLIKGKRQFCIFYFEHLFESLLFLYLHFDKDVRNYAYALDERLKDEVSSLFLDDYTTTDNNISKKNNIKINNESNDENLKFPVMYLLGKWGEKTHPALKILIISWIVFLESVSDIKMINYMNKIIPELLNLLCHQTMDVYQSSEFCLKKILCDIETQYESLSSKYPEIINEIVDIIIQNCNKLDEKIKISSFEWLEMFLKKYQSILEKSKSENKEKVINELFYQNICENNFIKGNIILSKKFLEEKNKYHNDYKILREINYKNNKLLIKGGFMEKSDMKKKISVELLINNMPYKFFSAILNVIINNTLNNNSPILLQHINQCNQIFKYIIANYPSNLLKNNLIEIEKVLLSYLSQNLNERCILLILEWTNQLYNQFESNLFVNEEKYIEKLINIIPDSNKNILIKIINILCIICDKQPSYVNYIINLIIIRFGKSENLINLYGIKVLKTLTSVIDINTLFRIFCDCLLKSNDINFVIKISKTLNMFLLAEKECQNIRNELSKKRKLSVNENENKINNNNNNNNKEDNLFEKLFYLWAFNPFTAVLLTMYCSYFELSYYLTLELSKIKLQENDYVELFQIVQIFESSIFNNIRIKLLCPKKNKFLVKTLYALLMMLPQSNAFDALNNRIRSVKTISKFDDGEDEDDLYDNQTEHNEEISPENKKIIIDKYINILKERYQKKIEYEKVMKQKAK